MPPARLPHALMAMTACLLISTVAPVAAETEDTTPPASEKPQTGRWAWTGPQSGNEHWVEVPKDYDPSRPCPVMMMVHGRGARGEILIKMGTCQAAVKRGWIAIAPTWTMKGSGTDSAEVVAELDGLFRLLAERYTIDPQLVVASGFSGGGGVSIGCFTRYADIFTMLVSQSSNFFGLAAPRRPVADMNRRPVLILWGQNDHPIILNEGPREVQYFQGQGYPVTQYVVPGGKHQTFPKHAWAWLDAVVGLERSKRLAAALQRGRRLSRPTAMAERAEALAPMIGLAAVEPPQDDESSDPFIRQWRDHTAKVRKKLTEQIAETEKLYAEALAEGRRQIAAVAERFSPRTHQADLRWMKRFTERWAAVPEICREAEAAYEKVHGEAPQSD